MGEIININIGKAGTRIGQKFLNIIAQQHFSDKQQKRGKQNVFFNENQKEYTARSIFMDIDPQPINKLRMKNQFFSIDQSNLFKGNGIYSDLYPTGHYLDGSQIVSEAIQKLRKQAQKCQLLSGFLLCNSLGGGTGSGMTSNLLQKLRVNYCPNIFQQHCIIPQVQDYYSPIQIYSTMLAFQSLIQNTDLSVLSQNTAVNKRIFKEGTLRPQIQDTNNMHAKHMSQITSPFRFGGNLNSNQRKTSVNLVLFPRMKFLVSSFSDKKQRYDHLGSSLDKNKLSINNFFAQANHNLYDIFAMQVNCRDNFIFQSQIDAKVRIWMQKQKLKFIEWLPNSIHTSIIQPPSIGPSSNALINSRHVARIFKIWSQLFTGSYRRRAFLHHFLERGMDQMEFTQAQSNINDIISEYIPCYFSMDQDEFYNQQDELVQIQEE